MDMKISQKLIEKLEEMKKFPINNSELCQQYIKGKGLCLFEELADILEKHTQYLDKNDQKVIDEIKVTNGEKFNISEDHDFKEWERYDILQLKKGEIEPKHFPEYILNDLTQQGFKYDLVSCIKSGLKCGRKLSDSDSRWIEKWYEVKCKDVSGAEKKNVVSDIIVKFYTKLWVNVFKNEIEGESLFQVLVDGSSGYHHDGLIYELKDVFKLENVLKKSGSLRVRKEKIKKTVPIVHKIQDSKREIVDSMQNDIE